MYFGDLIFVVLHCLVPMDKTTVTLQGSPEAPDNFISVVRSSDPEGKSGFRAIWWLGPI